MIGLACFLLLIILICCFFYYSVGEGFILLGDETKKYKIPINVYIVNDMKVTVETDGIENTVKGWLLESEAIKILNQSNAKFYNNYNIEWIPTYHVVTIPNTNEAKEDMNKFAQLSRETTTETKKNTFSSFFKHVPTPTKDTMSLYFITFLGHTQQGVCVTQGSNAPYMLVGQYSNKPGSYNPNGTLKMRQVDDIDGIPSLTFTVVHELAHALGLDHLNTDEPNVMNGTTSTFTANEDQIKRMRSVATFYAQQNGEIVDIDEPLELKPLLKRALPYSGVLPRGYYKINTNEMAAIPDHYYIYDEENMALIPNGFIAAEDKTYIFRASDELKSQIDKVDDYDPSDFSSYRENTGAASTTPVPTTPIVTVHPTTNPEYINTIVDQQNEVLRERTDTGSMGQYHPSPSYSHFDNHTITNTTALENTPGMLGGFCEQNKHSALEIEKKCSTLGKDVCASTNCCVLLGNETCVSGNERGPSYQDHYRNPMIPNRDYYYYKGKCYGNCKRS